LSLERKQPCLPKHVRSTCTFKGGDDLGGRSQVVSDIQS
jgi:hypothetical protein